MNSHNIPRKTSLPVLKSTRLLDQLREQIRYLHYSLRTEEAYVYWVKNFIRFHSLKHPRDMGQAEIEAFLSYLATQRKVSVSMPHALDSKYFKAGQTWNWHWVFAQATVSTDPRSKTVRRHHAYDQTFQRAFKQAVQAALNLSFARIKTCYVNQGRCHYDQCRLPTGRHLEGANTWVH